MTLRKAIIVLTLGVAGTLMAAWNLRGSAAAAFDLAGKAALTSAAVGLAGLLVLMLLGRRPLITQMTVVTLSTVGSVAAGAVAARKSMYVHQDALSALAVVLFSSGTIGVLVGLYLGHRVAEGSAELTKLARGIGLGGRHVPVVEPPTEELADLARELELTARRLEESRARASTLEEARRELVAWVSHDLRTPLSRIRAVVEALEDGLVSDPEEVAEYHRRIRVEADRLSLLVDGLFELSRITSGSLRLELRPTRLGDLVSDLAGAFSALAETRGVRLEASLHGLSPIVNASMEHLERALSNLLDNAIRYSDPGSRVKVDVGATGDEAYFSVEDGCGGMTAEEQAGLFDTNVARNRARRSNSGTGLGLVIAKGLIDAHDGTIAVDNTRTGCRVMVNLPIAANS